MSKKLYEINWKWPFFHGYIESEGKIISTDRFKGKTWVKLPDGRKGIIHHIKPDGRLGVRPIVNNDYCLNTTLHWSIEERKAIPEEYSFSKDQVEILK